jgi:hypothetical protein
VLQPQPAQENPSQEQPSQPPLEPVPVPQYQGLIQSDVRAYR